jgi:hypothetical protein
MPIVIMTASFFWIAIDMTGEPDASFLRELKRRNVYKVGAMYAVGGWLLVQVVTQVLPLFSFRAGAPADRAGGRRRISNRTCCPGSEVTPQGIARPRGRAGQSITGRTGQAEHRYHRGAGLAVTFRWYNTMSPPKPSAAAGLINENRRRAAVREPVG